MPNADVQIRDRLKTVREQLADLRQRKAEAKKDRDDAKTAFANADFSGDGDPKITESKEFKNAEEAVRKVGDLDDEINGLREAETAMLGLIGDSSDDIGPSNGNGPNPAAMARRTNWDGRALLQASDSYAEARERGLFHSTNKFGSIELGQIADRDTALQVIRAPSMAAVPNAPGSVSIGSPPARSSCRTTAASSARCSRV